MFQFNQNVLELMMKSTVILKASLNYFIVLLFIFSLYLSLLFSKCFMDSSQTNRTILNLLFLSFVSISIPAPFQTKSVNFSTVKVGVTQKLCFLPIPRSRAKYFGISWASKDYNAIAKSKEIFSTKICYSKILLP